MFTTTKQLSPTNATGNGVQPAKILSGPIWVTMFPGLKTLDALTPPFRQMATAFIDAMNAASMTVKISATLRPPQRAFLMHYSFLIALGQQDPKTVPVKPDVNIQWFHGNVPDSVKAAKEMVAAFGIATTKSKIAPALNSNHIAGNAVDMTITGFAGKKIKRADGTVVTVNTFDDLIKVGETYKVFHKLPGDKPHWSTTGK